MDSASCAGIDVEFFFPERGIGRSTMTDERLSEETRRALKVCASCPVRKECLDYGLEDDYGIFGGLLPRQRQILRNRTTPRRKGYGK